MQGTSGRFRLSKSFLHATMKRENCTEGFYEKEVCGFHSYDDDGFSVIPALGEAEQPAAEKTPEELYLEWFDASWPLVKNVYNLSTWVNPACSYYKEYLNADFLLLNDMRQATMEQVVVLQRLHSEYMERDIPNTYKFVQSAPTMLGLVRSMRESLVSEVPENYKYIDSLICSVIDDLTAMHTSLVSHTQMYKTLETWTCPSNSEDNIAKLERILLFQ